MMNKPNTEKEMLEQIWAMLAGLDDDGMYFQLKELTKKINDFIINHNNFRGETCPHRIDIDKVKKFIEEHNTKKEFRLKKWQAIIAALAFLVMTAFNVISYLK